MTGAQAVECPGPLTLFQYANGHLDRTQSERIASHVRTCPRCAEKVQATGNDGRSLADALEPREAMALETAEDVLRRLDLDLEFVDEADVEVAPAKPRAPTPAPSGRPTLPPPAGLRSRGLPPPVRKPTPMGSSLRSDPPPPRATVGPPPSFGSGGTKVAPAPQLPASSGDNTVRAPAPTRPPAPPSSKPAAAAGAPPVPVVRTTGSRDSGSAPVIDGTRSSRKGLYASIVVFALLGIGAAGALILYPRLTGEELRWASVVAVFDKEADETTKASDAPSKPEDEADKIDAKKVDAKTEGDAEIEDAKVEDAKAEDAKAEDAKAEDAPPPEGDAEQIDAKAEEEVAKEAPPPAETKQAIEETQQPAEAPTPPEPEAKQPADAPPPEPAADDTKLAAAKIEPPEAEPPAEPPPAEKAEPATEAAPPRPAVEPTPVAPARTPLYSEPVGSRDPGEASDLARRGALALRKSDVTVAEALFLRALAHDPRNAAALGGLASLHFGQGRHRTSLKFAAKAVNAAPQDADLRILLGDAYLETLGFANARREYEKAGALGHRSATARLARLQERLAAK